MHFTVDPMGHRSNPLTETDDPEGELTTDVGPLTELDPDLVACDDDEFVQVGEFLSCAPAVRSPKP